MDKDNTTVALGEIDDDGDYDGMQEKSTVTTAINKKYGLIRVGFPRPTTWMEMTVEQAIAVRDELTDKILELKSGRT